MPSVRIELLEDGGRAVDDGGGWMTLKAWNEYKAEHDKMTQEVELDARAQRILAGTSDTADGSETGDARAGGARAGGGADGPDEIVDEALVDKRR